MKKQLISPEQYDVLNGTLQQIVREYNAYLRDECTKEEASSVIRYSYAMEFKKNPCEKTLRAMLNEICLIYDIPMILIINNSVVTFYKDEIYITTKKREDLKKKSSVIIKETTKENLKDDSIHMLTDGITIRKYKRILKKIK